jgi:XapX domain-containing protein
MRSIAFSLIAGLVVGIGYGLCGIRSPAPPAIALLGLLGMLAGERGVVFALHHFGDQLAPAAQMIAQPSDEQARKLPKD